MTIEFQGTMQCDLPNGRKITLRRPTDDEGQIAWYSTLPFATRTNEDRFVQAKLVLVIEGVEEKPTTVLFENEYSAIKVFTDLSSGRRRFSADAATKEKESV